ncbi:type II toxin-antitoxin system death-on-curing family toxin [Alterinioella nitratireducens]|uniref:type II toxin-antitoxin system death-on-curing family toxin n=1 Tax=Alterinioella nitratireducens TaxID=2735915 RepID=UPI0040582641
MSLVLLPPDLVEAIHDSVLNQGELQVRARDEWLEGALAPVDHRLAYGMIEDAFDLAAAYAVAIATGHCFNDGNKRTAHQCMDVCLDLNGIEIAWDTVDVGDTIIAAAQKQIDAQDLADWLRVRAGD